MREVAASIQFFQLGDDESVKQHSKWLDDDEAHMTCLPACTRTWTEEATRDVLTVERLAATSLS